MICLYFNVFRFVGWDETLDFCKNIYKFITSYYVGKIGLEERLKSILTRIDGVGEVYVMITIKAGASKDILMEQDISYEDTDETDSSGGKRKKYTYSEDNQTVYVTDENGNTSPYVISENAPKIEGVAVIAEGADSAVTKQKIINVIKALFDIEINKISVE